MSEESSLQPKSSGSDTKMYRPAAEGGLEAAPDSSADYRDQLRSRRWNAAPLENPEVEKTDPRIAVAAIVLISAVTLIVLVAGYASGFWG
jgi:hypothetical protein